MPDASSPSGRPVQPSGPLAGIRVVEIASIGPGPFAAMMLADHGAEVLRIDKPGGRDVGIRDFNKDPMLRGRDTLELDLKSADDQKIALELIARADVVLEGFRPGVMERLNLGPENCHEVNPSLVYARMTGWGQSGPLARRAGHDINYIALAGALAAVGTQHSGPVPPLNLVGDFGGGGMMMAFGICAALLQAKMTQKGTVVDAAMVEGTALLMTMPFALKAQGLWPSGRGSNLLDGGAPFYGTYQTSDAEWVAIGAIEEPFWQELIEKLHLEGDVLRHRMNPSYWPQIHGLIAQRISEKTRQEWDTVFEGSDACFAPVLSMEEVTDHPHNLARDIFHRSDGVTQPMPAPQFSGHEKSTPPQAGTTVSSKEAIERWCSDTD